MKKTKWKISNQGIVSRTQASSVFELAREWFLNEMPFSVTRKDVAARRFARPLESCSDRRQPVGNAHADQRSTFSRSSTSSASSNTQYQLDRSPRSRPIVSFCSRKFLLCLAPTVLIFFIAGLLYLLRFERVDSLGAYRIGPRPAFPSHLFSSFGFHSRLSGAYNVGANAWK